MNPVDRAIAEVYSRIPPAPQTSPALLAAAEGVARRYMPGLAALLNQGNAAAYTARSFGVTPEKRDRILAIAEELDAQSQTGERRALENAEDPAAVLILSRLLRARSMRWRLDREVGVLLTQLVKASQNI